MNPTNTKRFAVLVSGYGRGAIEIIHDHRLGIIHPELALILSTNQKSQALSVAIDLDIATCVIGRESHPTHGQFEDAIVASLQEHEIEYVFLAGYMPIIKQSLLDGYQGRIVNVHPSLLPSFKGLHAIDQALNYGVRITGVTTHFVTAEVDGGPIIAQVAVPVEERDDFLTLDNKIFKAGTVLTSQTINKVFK